jgi:hypothetical protein
VSGLADTMPLNATAPDAPENRRITMLLIYPDPVVAGDMSDGATGAANRTESVD